MNSFLKKGAEADISVKKINNIKFLIKKRVIKKYRDKELDFKIRKRRTKSESKILIDLFHIVNVPKIKEINLEKCSICMEFLDGVELKKIIDKRKDLCIKIGEEIKKFHEFGIIHGDITTSNLIYFNKKIYFIDFGLGYYSKKIEDKAVDLVVFKKTFNATHSNIKNGFELVLKGYSPSKEILSKMQNIEKRARYH